MDDVYARKSTTGIAFTLAGGAIARMSRRQSITTITTAEAEYVAAYGGIIEAPAVRDILYEL